MRKKYLSALLFGALLLASAGTFTSCKDYDDDIKNLQEQINTVKTSLDELTTKVNSLGAGVKEFKYENGKLILVTDKDTNFEVELPACEGIKELTIKNGILYADGVEVGPIGGEGTTIEGDKVEVIDGVLYINGEAQNLNDKVGSNVTVLDNGSTYIMTVDGTSYVLPKASSSVAVKIINEKEELYNHFTNLSKNQILSDALNQKGIVWGTADKYRGDWGGLKPVAKGNLLVGQISTVKVQVLEATYDLSTAKLTLVNTLGEEAPVVVTPVAEGKFGPALDTRAADANGVWDLKIEMKNSVTPENVDVAFAAKDGSYAYKNVKYALAVDGNVVTDYEIIVDTQTGEVDNNYMFKFDSTNGVNLAFKKNGVDMPLYQAGIGAYNEGQKDPTISNVANFLIPINTETTLYLVERGNSKSIDYVYDSYIEILDKDLADRYGIKAEGMKLNVSEDAKALKGLRVRLHVLDVNGNEVKSEILGLNFAASTAAGQEIADQSYTVMPSTVAGMEFVLVDLGNTFTALTAEEADKISKANADDKGAVDWYSITENKVFNVTGSAIEGGLVQISNASAIKYYASKEDALKYGLNPSKKSITFDGSVGTIDPSAPTVREITYAVLPLNMFKNEALPNTQVPFTISLKDGEGNELKKVSANLTLTVPEFDDVLVANSEQNVWVDGVFNTRVIPTGNKAGKITLVKAFKSKANANGDAYLDINKADARLMYDLKYVDFNEENQYIDELIAAQSRTLNGTIVKDGKLVHDIDVTATLTPMGDQLKNFKVTKTFKVYLQSVFEGATMSYYNTKGELVTGALALEGYEYVHAGVRAADGTKTGAFINYDGEVTPFNFRQETDFVADMTVNKPVIGEKLSSVNRPSAANEVNSYIYLGDGADGTIIEASVDGSRGSIKISVPGGSKGGRLLFKFVDEMGVEVDHYLDYVKSNN